MDSSKASRFPRFDLTLMVTRNCNLDCRYCYIKDKTAVQMSFATGQRAIVAAARSTQPGGTLAVGFFGGEPLLEADLILDLIGFTETCAAEHGLEAEFSLTTNGTIRNAAARQVLSHSRMRISLSCDGLPEVHDRHRVTRSGRGSHVQVMQTADWLRAEGIPFRTVMVVRPDTVDLLDQGIAYLFSRGITAVEPSLDVWSAWGDDAIARLEAAVERCAEVWYANLPDAAVSWFDEKAALLTGKIAAADLACGFGRGELTITPAGHLYPCERLVGSDAADNPMRLARVLDDVDDFTERTLGLQPDESFCGPCRLSEACGARCRCDPYLGCRMGTP